MYLLVRGMTKQESGSHKAQTCWVKCPFPVWQVLLSLCPPYHLDTLPKPEWRTALNDFLVFDSDTGPSPFMHNMKVYFPPWISTLEPMSTSTHATPYSHPAICVKTNMFLSHLAWIRQLKPVLLNRWTDSQCYVSSQWDWYPPPQEMRTSFPEHTHSHNVQLGLLFTVSRNQALSCVLHRLCVLLPSCLTWEY